jgi:hypothetical protein
MNLLTVELYERLLANGRAQALVVGTDQERDFFPVVRLFIPYTDASWLLTELDPDVPDLAFGLCDMGLGCPEIGSVSFKDLAVMRSMVGLKVQRDPHFTATKPLSAYAEEARREGRIIA